MDELQVSNKNTIDAKTLAEQFAKEKTDIICGFLKEKEIIEIMHKEEISELVDIFEQEKDFMRRQFELEREDLLEGFQIQQVKEQNRFQREQNNLETKTSKEFECKERNADMKYKAERLKMRQEYEVVIAEKNEEIKTLRRELLRLEHQDNRLARSSPDNDIYIRRTEHEEKLRCSAENFETEKLDFQRKFDREKAELVHVFADQTERMNANFDHVKKRMQEDHEKELEFKLEITERLLSEKADLDAKRMLEQFERKITELKESLEKDYTDTLLERQEAIDNLEKEKKELLSALQNERFSLARVYNREISLLTKPDQLTKEDTEVALIDEIAKLKQQYEDAIAEMEEQHRQKIEVVKRNQRPIRELELQHRKEVEKLKRDFQNEKEFLETEFRKEQLNLLKSFEFERNDLEQRYEEMINERELEIQQREEDLRRVYEEELDGLKSIVGKQRDELEMSKQKLADLADQMEAFLSEKNRLEERYQKENNQCQTLEQTMEKNLETFEKNMKEVEAFYQKELAQKTEELARDKEQLQKLEEDKLELQKEVETLKSRLDELQVASEIAIEVNSEGVLESAIVDNIAHEELDVKIGEDELNPAGARSPLEEGKEGPKGDQETENKKKEQVNECLYEIKERLKKCIPNEEKLKTLDDFQMSNKQMKNAINQEIAEIDKLCSNKDEGEDVLVEEELQFNLEDQLQAVENFLTESNAVGSIDKPTKNQLNERMKGILKKADRLHKFEKLKLKEEQQEEISKLLKELADEDEKSKILRESMDDLKNLQQSNKSKDGSRRHGTEEIRTSPNHLDGINFSLGSTRMDNKKKDACSPSDVVEELRREKEEMKRSIDELEKSFNKEKEELMEKLQTQHKEFAMSTEGEIIENLLRQKSNLEDAFNLERFYLSRLYYLEMKEELEDILCRRKEKMKREFDRDKMNIIFKYESDITDLHKLLSEKDEMELKLLQDRNEVTKKLLAAQKSDAPEKRTRKRKKDKERLEREKEKLEVTIPLKKHIADLQKKRHQEHETAVANLKEAIHLVKDIMCDTPLIAPGGDQHFDRLSFLSEDPMRSVATSPVDKSREDGLKPRKRMLVSEEEIRNKDELKDALENLVEIILFDDEESVYNSQTTCGASSDLESDDTGATTVAGESDEGAFSGPESNDGEMLSIKKDQLNFAFNLERFSLGRVYYGEYRDSLKKAMKKLAKAKETLRSKRKDLESDMLNGIKSLVSRTKFGEENKQAPKRDIDTQTTGEAVTFEEGIRDAVHGVQLPEVKAAENDLVALTAVEGGVIDSQKGSESDQEVKEVEDIHDKGKLSQEVHAELPESFTGDLSPHDEKLTGGRKAQKEGDSNRDHGENEVENAPVAEKSYPQPKTGKDDLSHVQEQGREEKEDSELVDKNSGLREHVCTPFRDTETEVSDGFMMDKNESVARKGVEEMEVPSEEKVDQAIQTTNAEGADIPPATKGDQQDGKDDMKDDNGETYFEDAKENENVDDMKSTKVEDKISPEHKSQKEPNRDETEVNKVEITPSSEEKDTKKDILEETEDEADITKPQVAGKIYPTQKPQTEVYKDERECEKDEIATESEEKGTIQYNLGETKNAADIENPQVQKEPNEDEKEFEKDEITSDSEEKGVKGYSLEETKNTGNKEDPQEQEKSSSEQRSQKEPNKDENEFEKDEITAETEGKDAEEDILLNTGNARDIEETQVGDKISPEKRSEERVMAIKDKDEEKQSEDSIDYKPKRKGGESPKCLTEKAGQNGDETNDIGEFDQEQPFGNTNVSSIKHNTPVDSPLDEEENVEKSKDGNLSVTKGKKKIDEYDSLSEKSDSFSLKEDKEEEDLRFVESASPITDQDLINQLNKNNKILQDKFNLLRELVGKGFVNEIPELSDKRKGGDSGAALGSLSDLYAEKEQLLNELKQIDLQMKELNRSGNEDTKDLNKRLEDEESEILHSLEQIDKQLRQSNEKDLVDHFLREKEDVCNKLDEINNLLDDKKEVIAQLRNSDTETVPGLMSRRDMLKDDSIEKLREANFKSKMLKAATKASEKENEKLKTSLNRLKFQLEALEDSTDDAKGERRFKTKKRNERLPPEMASLLASKAETESKSLKLDKKLRKIGNDIARYERLLEEQKNRLQPFERKKSRLEKALKSAGPLRGQKGQLTVKKDEEVMAGDQEGSINERESIAPNTADENIMEAEDDTISQGKKELEKEIKDLNDAICNIKSPRGLYQKLTDDTPTSKKLEIVHEANLSKEEDLQLLKAEIYHEGNKLRNDGLDDPTQLIHHLEKAEKLKKEITKLDNSQLNLDGTTTGAENPDVKKLVSLLLLKESLEETSRNLDDEIFEEQANFLDVRQFKGTGKVDSETASKIKELIDTKAKLVYDLKETNETILQSLSKGGLTGPYAGFIEECVERKVRLEEEIENLQDEIDEETIRAAAKVAGLVERKSTLSEELRKVVEELQTIKENFSNDKYNNNISEDAGQIISQILDQESVATPEKEKLLQRQSKMEGVVKEKAERVMQCKRRGRDQNDEEEALENAIREKISVDQKLQKVLGDKDVGSEKKAHMKEGQLDDGKEPVQVEEENKQQSGEVLDDEDGEGASVKEEIEQGLHPGSSDENFHDRRRELEEDFRVNDNKLHILLKNAELSHDHKTTELENLKCLIVEKVKLEDELEQSRWLEDLLSKMQNLEEKIREDVSGRKSQLESELEKSNAVIKRRVKELQKIQAKKDAREEALKRVNDEKEELDERLGTFKDKINKARKEVETNLEEVQRIINENEHRSNEEQQELRQELEELQQEIERSGKKEKELEKELHRLKKEPHYPISDVLDLEKLLIDKESLRVYLAEIDAALDDSETDASEGEDSVKVDELRNKKRVLETSLEELRNQKAKMDVEYEDEEIDEAIKGLLQRKTKLENRDREISEQIRNSGILGKMAQRTKNWRSEIPPYYIQGILNEMARDEKTLTELIKEQQELKNAAQRQRDNLEGTIALVKSKVGEDLMNLLAPSSPDANEPNIRDQYQPLLDEIEGNEATISNILEDLGEENKELRGINDGMNLELEMLKEKVGEELVNEMLSHTLPIAELEFGDVINAIKDDEKTLASILHEQTDKIDAIEATLGKDLFDSILRKEGKPDTKGDIQFKTKLMAPVLMRNFDEDLENVIAIYEKELDDLSYENEVLKDILGKDLANELLAISKNYEKPEDEDRIQHTESSSKIQDEETDDSMDINELQLLPGEGLVLTVKKDKDENDAVVKGTDQETDGSMTESVESQEIAESEATPLKMSYGPQQERKSQPEKHQNYHPMKKKQARDPDEYEGDQSLQFQDEKAIAPRLYKICSPYFSSAPEMRPPVLPEEADKNVKPSLNAPKIMRDNGKTLGEIIAQYECDLLRSSGGKIYSLPLTELNDSDPRSGVNDDVKHVHTSDVDKTLQDIVEAQDKNMEILRVLKERLGEDLVDALINGTEEDHSDDLVSVNSNTCDNEDLQEHPGNDSIGDSKGGNNRPFEETATIPPENQTVQENATEVKKIVPDSRPREMPRNIVDADEEDLVTGYQHEQDNANSRKLKAPNIALEKKKTLADVIASYEKGLESLQSKLGPSLTRTLLAMEEPVIPDNEVKLDQAATERLEEEMSEKEDINERRERSLTGKKEKERDDEFAETSDKSLELVSAEETSSTAKELRAPDIMVTSGKTLEEVIENYEERINDELSQLEKEVSLLKEKLGNDLFLTLLTQSEKNNVPSQTSERTTPTLLEEEIDQQYSEARKPQSAALDEELQPEELKANSLLKDEGNTVENILRRYEKQLEELTKLVPRENDESASVLDLISDYEDKIAHLESKNKTLVDQLANLSECIGQDLMKKLKGIDEYPEHNTETEDARDGVQAPLVMKKEDKTLENVVRNYEKELDTLRKMLPIEDGEGISFTDIVKDYEDKIDDLESRTKCLQTEQNGLVKRIGHHLVDDIMALKATEDDSGEDMVEQTETDLSRKPEIKNFKDLSSLNAPVIMKNDDSTLEAVLEMYEKALGLFPRPPVPQDESFVDNKIHTFENFKRENKILKDALGDGFAGKLIAKLSEKVPRSSCFPKDSETSKAGDMKLSPPEKEKQPHQGQMEGGITVSTDQKTQLNALQLATDDGITIENILKNYEKELEALRELVPSETSEGMSVSDLVTSYEEKIEKLQNENQALVDKLGNLTKNIGPGLMDDLQTPNSDSGVYGAKNLDGTIPSKLEALVLVQAENRTLEGVLRAYENELDALRRLIPSQGEEANTISDIIKDYEDKLRVLADENEDKVDKLQGQNKDLKSELEALEGNIGSNLFDDLKRICREKDYDDRSLSDSGLQLGSGNESKVLEKLMTPEIMKEKELTLESIILSFEKELQDLKRENEVLKDGLGQRLADILLNAADKEEGLPVAAVHSSEIFLQGEEPRTTSPLPRKGRKGVKRGRRQQTEQGSIDNVGGISSQKFNKDDSCDMEVKTGDGCDLKAESLIADEGRTIENILENYEKQIEALEKLAPSDDAVSVSDLVKTFKDKADGLENENSTLVIRIENLKQKVGEKLLNEVENSDPEGARATEDSIDIEDDERLKAPQIMEKEERTLENVIRTYEREIDVLRNLVPTEADGGITISDMVQEYEDKLDQLRRKNESLRNDSKSLQSRIGHDLVNEIKKLEEITTDVSEDADLEMSKSAKELKVTKIMEVKQSTLEDVLETYESALGTLLGDTSASVDDVMPDNSIDDKGSSTRNLKEENDILKSSVGIELAQRLLIMAKEGKGFDDSISDYNDQIAQISEKDTDNEHASIKEIKKASSDNRTSPEELQAETVIREEGRTIENILKNYEKELETLKSLVLNGSGQPADTFSDLVRKYEDEKDELKKENGSLANRLEFLERKIGTGLTNELQRPQNSEKSFQCAIKSELNVPLIMEKEDRTLESVVKCYEKELEVFRKLALNQEQDHGTSISDIIKEYEDKLENLTSEKETLKTDFSHLTDRLGSNLFNDIKKLEDRSFEADEPSDVNTKEPEITGKKKWLKAPNIMRKENVTLENVLERYEGALDEREVSGHQLETVSDLKKENQVFKTTLGENLTKTILEAAMGDKGEGNLDHDASTRSAVRKPDGDLHERGQERKASLPTSRLDKPPYDDSLKRLSEEETYTEVTDTVPPSDKVKANTLIKNEGRTVEGILKNYECESEALSKLLPTEKNPGYSISDLVKSYEDRIETLKTFNSGLSKRFEILTERVGKDLVRDLEKNEFINEGDKDQLKAPVLVAGEGKALENIVRTYEKELEALRKTTAGQGEGENKYTISDIVNEYEGKLDGVKTEIESLKDGLGSLKQRIGLNLVKDIMSTRSDEGKEKPTVSEEVQISKGQPILKAPKIMEERNLTLEDVLASYESALPMNVEDLIKTRAEDTYGDYKQDIDISKTDNKINVEEIKLLKEKVGTDLANELLQLEETDPGRKPRWEAVEKIKDEETTLADILDIYEGDLERLRREKKALEVLVNDNGNDGKSALNIISQYEDEIEHLKGKTKELDSKLSTLFAKVGDNLVHDILCLTPSNGQSTSLSLQALETMATQGKQLSAVIEQYENNLKTLERENEALRCILNHENVDGKPLTSLISDYEMKIQELQGDKTETESGLRVLTEKIGESLTNKMLNPSEERQELQLDALKMIENDGKTLADVLEEYEDDLARIKREISALRDLVSEDSDMSSFMGKISKYEDDICNLNNKIKEQAILERKVGVDLSKQIMELAESIEGKRQGTVFLKAVEEMEKDNDVTLTDVVKGYEEELEKKNHEILTLKQLISDDMLEIASSQESEIYELKKVKTILANELDALSDRVGQELSHELLKRSTQQPTTESGELYREVIQRMEKEGKQLQSIIEDLDQEIKLTRVKNEELRKKEEMLEEVSGKLGKDLFSDLLKTDEPDSIKRNDKTLFEAFELMSVEEKTLGEVILGYEKQLAKLKRENGALRLLTENGSSQDTSVIDVLSDYEERIEKLDNENRELQRKMQRVSQRVGVDLTQELLKLSDEVCKSTTEGVNELNALRMLKEDNTTITDVLQSYEEKLRVDYEGDLGPLVSGKLKKEEIKLAQLVHVDENEPEITISKEEPCYESRYLQGAESDDTMASRANAAAFEQSIEDGPLDNKDQIQKLADANTKLRRKLEQLSRKVGKELSEELTRSPEDEDREVTAAVRFASVRDLKAFDDLIAERQTLAQVLERYEKKLEGTMRGENGPLDESLIVEEGIKRAQLLQANEYVEDVCDIGEMEIVSHYNLPDDDSNEQENVDGHTVPDLSTLDFMSLEDLIPDNPQVMAHSKEPVLLRPSREIIDEEILQVELPIQDESLNFEFAENLFASNIAIGQKGDRSKVSESSKTEHRVDTKDDEKVTNLEKTVIELQKELEEEKLLKERYEKDVQDLLKDIVDLKMKQAEDDEENPEETRRKIQEEMDLKQENKRLQEDLKKERKRRVSVEESKRDLLDEVDNLMREKQTFLKQQNEPKDSEKLLEDMIILRKKIGELDTKNKNLTKEVKDLKDSIKELGVCHEEEKNQLLANCEKEKSEMTEELVASKRELESQLQELFGMNEDLKGTVKHLLEELKESNERLVTEEENQVAKESEETDRINTEEGVVNLLQKAQENERGKNENLKEQFDEQQGKDFDNVVQKEAERLKEDMELELEREKKKLRLAVEEKEDELKKQAKKLSAELLQQEEQWNKEKQEMQAIFRIEKEKLQKAFDEELRSKIAEKEDEQRQRNEEKDREFAQEKKEIKSNVERKIYEQLIDKNIAAETDFQEVLSKILQEHSKEIEGVENDIRKAEERFKEDKTRIIEQMDKEKEALKKAHEEEKRALESTVQDLLKEVIKLKNQRKEIRLIHKKEKESMEEIYERDRLKLREDWEQYKRDLFTKLQEEFDNKLANEITKLETRLEDVKRELERSEQRRKELEERLRGIPSESEPHEFEQEANISKADVDKYRAEYLKELKSVKKTLEEEYDKKLNEEKRKFEETLQGLRREIGSLQEKRRVIQDKLYSQDPTVVDRHLMEKSLANYKMEMLSKMEEEFALKVAREKKPLEETINELQREVDDLKRQRWELRNQLRRERAKLEEEFELEKENLEKQFLKEKEELKSKLESRIQREMSKRAAEDKLNRALSPISNVSTSKNITLGRCLNIAFNRIPG